MIFTMPASHKHKEVTWMAHIDENDQTNSRYDMIIGRDIMFSIGMDLDFSNCSMN